MVGDVRDIEDTYGNQARQRYRIHNPDRGRLPVVAMPYAELAGDCLERLLIARHDI